MEDLAVIVSALFFGGIALGLAAAILGWVSRRRPRVRPFAYVLTFAALPVGVWFVTISGPLGSVPVIGGLIGAAALFLPKR